MTANLPGIHTPRPGGLLYCTVTLRYITLPYHTLQGVYPPKEGTQLGRAPSVQIFGILLQPDIPPMIGLRSRQSLDHMTRSMGTMELLQCALFPHNA